MNITPSELIEFATEIMSLHNREMELDMDEPVLQECMGTVDGKAIIVNVESRMELFGYINGNAVLAEAY